MTPARWREVKALYFGALDQPAEQRSAWLAERCQDDEGLQAEIEQLLAGADGSAVIDDPPARGLLSAWSTGPALRDGHLLGGRFEIVKHLGSGGMGDVYEAVDRDLGTHVAVKLIRATVAGDPHALARFRREIALARQVTHRSVCRVFDFFPAGESNDFDFLTMELLHGETLAAKLRRDGPMALAEALPLLRQIATGLDAAHSAGVLHRDLKGSNIFLVASSGGPRAVLMDFGLARSSAGNDTVSTGSAWAAGTPAYMSPEQLEGNELGPASDIYSLGVVMYEMATGRPPHEGHSPLQIAVRRLKETPKAPREFAPSIDERWESAILRCLAQAPKDRFETGAALIESLESPAPMITWTAARKPVFAAAAMGLAALAWFGYDRFSAPTPLRPDVARWYREGVTAMGDGSPTKAVKLFENALAADSSFTAARCRLAEAYQELDMRDRAQEEMLAAVSGKMRSRSDRALCDGVRAQLTGQWDEAIAAAAMREEIGDLEEQGVARLDRARWLTLAGRTTDAVSVFESILAKDESQPGAALRLAVIRGRQDKISAALVLLDKAATGFRALGNSEGVGETSYRRAVVLTSQSVAKAAEAIEIAERATKDTDNPYLESRVLRRRAEILQRQGDSEGSKRFLLRAAEIADSAGLGGEAVNALLDLGFLPFAQGRYEEAEQDFMRALRIAKRHRAKRAEARTMLSLAQVYLRTGRPEDAHRMFPETIGFYRSTGELSMVAESLIFQGDTYQIEGKFEQAERSFTEAETLSEAPAEKIRIRQRKARLLLLRGGYEEAVRLFTEFSKFFDSAGDRTHGQFNRIETASALRLLGRFREAEAELDRVESEKPATPQIAAAVEFEKASIAFDQDRQAESIARLEALRIRAKASRDTRTLTETDWRLCGRVAESSEPSKALPYCDATLRAAPAHKQRVQLVRNSYALVHLSRSRYAQAAEAAREAVTLAMETKDLNNVWYSGLVLTEALHGAKDPAWKQERTRTEEAFASWRRRDGEAVAAASLRRPVVGARVRRVQSLQ
ncbi:MAG: tetratricopeptide repeat protein [Acidobacteria bacterium]|nr:tetratricopeptide repeat protein [Acidobacteriota bacterium]